MNALPPSLCFVVKGQVTFVFLLILQHTALSTKPCLQYGKVYCIKAKFFLCLFTVRELRRRNIAWGCFISPQPRLHALCTLLHLVFLIICLSPLSYHISPLFSSSVSQGLTSPFSQWFLFLSPTSDTVNFPPFSYLLSLRMSSPFFHHPCFLFLLLCLS